MRETSLILHERFNPRSHVSPVIVENFDRTKLAKLFADLGFKRGAEIGVESGAYSRTLCQNIPDLELWCVDPWRLLDGYPWGSDTESEIQKHMDKTAKRVEGYNAHLVRDTSMEARIDGMLDFVYIDANHKYKYVVQDIAKWSRKVRDGGIVAGHDYIHRFNGVIDAVNEYTAANNITEWFVDDQSASSYFWVNNRERKGVDA